MVVMTGATVWTGATSGGIASMVAMMGVCHRLDCRVVVASSGGIASMVVMTGATAWTTASSGGIASMVAMTGATAWTAASSSRRRAASHPWWR